MATVTTNKPFRVAEFISIERTDEVLRRLRQAGFAEEQISVICSDKEKERHFRRYEHQEPAGYHVPQATVGGGIIGATIGALCGTVISVMSDVPWMIAIAAGAFGVGVLGGFAGTMSTRGEELEPSDFYDQAIIHGHLLVAVEDHSDQADERLAIASNIFEEAGSRSIELSEG